MHVTHQRVDMWKSLGYFNKELCYVLLKLSEENVHNLVNSKNNSNPQKN